MVKKKPTKKEMSVARVISVSGAVVREFTRKEHGNNFKDIAKQFVGKYAGNDFEVVIA